MYTEGHTSSEGGFNGAWAMILLVIVVVWLLFARGRDDGYGGGGNCGNGAYPFAPYAPYAPYPYPAKDGNCCFDCKPKMAIDMSNCEVDKDLWKVDADLKECCCEEKALILKESCSIKEATHLEGEKTRALIEANLIAELKEKLCEKNSKINQLEGNIYVDGKFDMINSKLGCYENNVDKMFCKTNAHLDAIECKMLEKPRIFAEGFIQDCGTKFPQRKHDCCECGCGCN